MAEYYLGSAVLWFCDVLGLGVLERLLDVLILKQRMWVFLSSFLLVQFDSIFFLSRFSGLVLVRYYPPQLKALSIQSRYLQCKSRRRRGDH